MTKFFDTSVLVAAFSQVHPRHDASFRAFAAASKSSAACSAHSLAEVYAVMTRLPVRPHIAPEHAMLFLQEIRSRLTIVPLDEADYFDTLTDLANRGISGGTVYDALLLRCAVKSAADAIYTWNVRHFKQIAPDLADRILTP